MSSEHITSEQAAAIARDVRKTVDELADEVTVRQQMTIQAGVMTMTREERLVIVAYKQQLLIEYLMQADEARKAGK